MIFCSVQRSVSCPVVIREIFSAGSGSSGRDSQPDITQSLNWRYHIPNMKTLRKGRLCESKGMEDTRKALSTGSIKQSSHVLTETEVAVTGPAWV